MPAKKSLIGKKFARLTVVASGHRTYPSGTIRSTSVALCDCGNKIEVDSTNLVLGRTKSCGCLRRELLSKQQKTHGQTIGGNSRTYWSWRTMRDRCTNPRLKHWDDYGGRGIRVCDRWQKFENFLSDMGERPEGKTLDRWPNNDGNYEPGNCRWATAKEQNRHSRANRIVTFRGETACLSEMCERLQMPYKTVRQRISGYGWSVEDALSKPIRRAWLNTI